MEPITTLSGYIISKFLHGIRIFLLTATPVFFLSHESIARNIKNKAPTTEDSGGTLRAVLTTSQRISPESTLFYTGTETNQNEQQEKNLQIQAHSSLNEIAATHYPTTSKPEQGEALERAYTKLQSHHILLTVKKSASASDADMQLFRNYYYDKIFGTDRSYFWQQVNNGQISTDSDIANFAQQKIDEYTSLLLQFMKIEKEYPSSVSEYTHRPTHSDMGTCNPACDNIGFESGDLTAWNTYYA